MVASAPGWAAALGDWEPAPFADLILLLATLSYLWLARRVTTATRNADSEPAPRWPARRIASWFGAMLVIVLAVNGPVGRFADVLFWVHMVQHLMLIMIAPTLLVWAQPVRLLRDAGRRVGAGVDRLLVRRPTRWATAPLTGLAVYTAVVVLTHLTEFQQLSATHSGVRAAELTLYVLAGWLFFYPLLGGELGPWSLPYLLRFVVLAVGMGADTLTGVVLMLTARVIAPAYAAAHAGWGPSPLRDQEVAGAIMWFGGDLLMMLLMIVVALRWGRASSAEQGLGSWLEGARRRSLLGADDPAFEASGAGGRPSAELDIDSDQRALDAYNAALAALHAQHRQPRDTERR